MVNTYELLSPLEVPPAGQGHAVATGCGWRAEWCACRWSKGREYGRRAPRHVIPPRTLPPIFPFCLLTGDRRHSAANVVSGGISNGNRGRLGLRASARSSQLRYHGCGDVADGAICASVGHRIFDGAKIRF